MMPVLNLRLPGSVLQRPDLVLSSNASTGPSSCLHKYLWVWLDPLPPVLVCFLHLVPVCTRRMDEVTTRSQLRRHLVGKQVMGELGVRVRQFQNVRNAGMIARPLLSVGIRATWITRESCLRCVLSHVASLPVYAHAEHRPVCPQSAAGAFHLIPFHLRPRRPLLWVLQQWTRHPSIMERYAFLLAAPLARTPHSGQAPSSSSCEQRLSVFDMGETRTSASGLPATGILYSGTRWVHTWTNLRCPAGAPWISASWGVCLFF